MYNVEFLKEGDLVGKNFTGKKSSFLFSISIICLPELILPSSVQSLFDVLSLPYMAVGRIN